MLWIKTFHIVLIASWFAGLFYLPRIFVNLAMETEPAAVKRLADHGAQTVPLHVVYRGAGARLRAVVVARGRYRTRAGMASREGWRGRAAGDLPRLLRGVCCALSSAAKTVARTSGTGCSMNCRCWGCWPRSRWW